MACDNLLNSELWKLWFSSGTSVLLGLVYVFIALLEFRVIRHRNPALRDPRLVAVYLSFIIVMVGAAVTQFAAALALWWSWHTGLSALKVGVTVMSWVALMRIFPLPEIVTQERQRQEHILLEKEQLLKRIHDQALSLEQDFQTLETVQAETTQVDPNIERINVAVDALRDRIYKRLLSYGNSK